MRWWALLAGALLIVYPLFVYWGMRWLEPRFIGLILVFVYALRLAISTQKLLLRVLILVTLGVVAVTFWLINSELLLQLVPVFINLVLALFFGYTLYKPPTLPARMAQLQHGFMTPAIEQYTTLVTIIWVAFFCINGSVALITALWLSREWWVLYNGLISYLLIGALLAIEYAYRRLVFFKKHNL